MPAGLLDFDSVGSISLFRFCLPPIRLTFPLPALVQTSYCDLILIVVPPFLSVPVDRDLRKSSCQSCQELWSPALDEPVLFRTENRELSPLQGLVLVLWRLVDAKIKNVHN
jgi:hypothetical protein